MLRAVPVPRNDRLTVGPEKFSDAGIFRVRADLALVLTVDFFPPVVDDPHMYGAIAAANALSDCYAMGGRPLAVLCVAGFPEGFNSSWIEAIFRGGFEKVAEAGAVVAGGHTVRHSEPMFGFSVTGEVHPDRVITNDHAKPGDVLFLTKPIGCGAVTTGIKKGKSKPQWIEAAMASMAALNRAASEAAVEAGASAATDVTGFGLLGHAANIARASEVTLTFHADSIPTLPGALELAAAGCLSGGAGRTREALGAECEYGTASQERISLALDSETSGGLLIAVPPERADTMAAALSARGIVPKRVGVVEPASRFVVRIA